MTQASHQRVVRFWASFGPGLLWAAAAIGVSHLVQSTRAGATAGLGLAGVIVLALVLKYPFFEYGPRYAAATGMSLVEGYRHIGRWALWLYFLITVTTSVIVQTAIILFTSFLLNYVFGLSLPIPLMGALLLIGCGGMLWVGRFPLLDGAVKVILVLLALSTVAAAVVTLGRVDAGTLALWPSDALATGAVRFAFILALVGWMPSAIDISVWSSLWTLAKDKAAGARASVAAARLDFFIGYAGTGFLAFCFLILGAGVMFGSGTAFSGAGPVFSTQLVHLYSTTLGEWTRPIVLVAVLTTMLSTSITVVDGFPRALERSFVNLKPGHSDEHGVPSAGVPYWVTLVALAASTVLVLVLFVGNLTTMVDFATIVSFLTAPVLGYLNLRVVNSPEVAPEHRPGRAMLVLSWVGLLLLGGTAVVYVGMLIG
ncbi:MAG: divalent metal cation transporter [Gemmatimonadales bacterium]|nr:divalent metal cation transporter [Gemmatimonadales bacterium]